MKVGLSVCVALAAGALAACGESEQPKETSAAQSSPATGEENPATLPATDPQAATDAPQPEPIDDEGERLYRKGLYKEALTYWRKAAAQGDAYANYRLGVEYLDAKVVERDIDKVAAYQKRAAELGDPRGMFELATLYEFGQGVEQSHELAAKYYLMAAERGLPEAQHNIATMYETGTGVNKDLVQAYKFYGLARAQGFDVFGSAMGGGGETAPDPMKVLEELMTEEQLAEARRQIAEFEPKK